MEKIVAEAAFFSDYFCTIDESYFDDESSDSSDEEERSHVVKILSKPKTGKPKESKTVNQQHQSVHRPNPSKSVFRPGFEGLKYRMVKRIEQ